MQQNFNSMRELSGEDLDNVAGAGVTWTELYTYVVKGSGEKVLSIPQKRLRGRGKEFHRT